LWGEEIAIDCLSMRDRTWSVRPDLLPDLNILAGYMHGAISADDCWLVMGVGTIDDPTEQAIPEGTGSLVLDGKTAKVTGGLRRVLKRIDGRPALIEIEINDELGRQYRIRGEALNHLGTSLTPTILNWFSLYRWTDDRGRQYFGESQESWIPLSRYQRARALERI